MSDVLEWSISLRRPKGNCKQCHKIAWLRALKCVCCSMQYHHWEGCQISFTNLVTTMPNHEVSPTNPQWNIQLDNSRLVAKRICQQAFQASFREGIFKGTVILHHTRADRGTVNKIAWVLPGVKQHRAREDWIGNNQRIERLNFSASSVHNQYQNKVATSGARLTWGIMNCVPHYAGWFKTLPPHSLGSAFTSC